MEKEQTRERERNMRPIARVGIASGQKEFHPYPEVDFAADCPAICGNLAICYNPLQSRADLTRFDLPNKSFAASALGDVPPRWYGWRKMPKSFTGLAQDSGCITDGKRGWNTGIFMMTTHD